MRCIGSLSDAAQARAFGDFLIGRGVRNEIERDAEDSWSVWIVDENQVATGTQWLGQFRADPDAPEFRRATAEAARVRKAQADDLAQYRRRVRTRQSLFPRLGGYGVGVLTYSLIIICMIVAAYSRLGANRDLLRVLFISDPESGRGMFLPEVFQGEVWRLFTPMFVHFGILHLLFNLAWLYQLGCLIEARQSWWKLGAIIAVSGALSNFAQYFVSGPSFGGMSGVVYGLAGYVWMRGKYDPASGLGLDSRSVTILLVWLVVCFSGILGPIANTAHVVGLIVGVVWGRISAHYASGKSE